MRYVVYTIGRKDNIILGNLFTQEDGEVEYYRNKGYRAKYEFNDSEMSNQIIH